MSKYTVEEIQEVYAKWAGMFEFLSEQFDWYSHLTGNFKREDVERVDEISPDGEIEFRTEDYDGDHYYRILPLSVLLDEDDWMAHAERVRTEKANAEKLAREKAAEAQKKRAEDYEKATYLRLKRKYEGV